MVVHFGIFYTAPHYSLDDCQGHEKRELQGASEEQEKQVQRDNNMAAVTDLTLTIEDETIKADSCN